MKHATSRRAFLRSAGATAGGALLIGRAAPAAAAIGAAEKETFVAALEALQQVSRNGLKDVSPSAAMENLQRAAAADPIFADRATRVLEAVEALPGSQRAFSRMAPEARLRTLLRAGAPATADSPRVSAEEAFAQAREATARIQEFVAKTKQAPPWEGASPDDYFTRDIGARPDRGFDPRAQMPSPEELQRSVLVGDLLNLMATAVPTAEPYQLED